MTELPIEERIIGINGVEVGDVKAAAGITPSHELVSFASAKASAAFVSRDLLENVIGGAIRGADDRLEAESLGSSQNVLDDVARAKFEQTLSFQPRRADPNGYEGGGCDHQVHRSSAADLINQTGKDLRLATRQIETPVVRLELHDLRLNLLGDRTQASAVRPAVD